MRCEIWAAGARRLTTVYLCCMHFGCGASKPTHTKSLFWPGVLHPLQTIPCSAPHPRAPTVLICFDMLLQPHLQLAAAASLLTMHVYLSSCGAAHSACVCGGGGSCGAVHNACSCEQLSWNGEVVARWKGQLDVRHCAAVVSLRGEQTCTVVSKSWVSPGVRVSTQVRS